MSDWNCGIFRHVRLRLGVSQRMEETRAARTPNFRRYPDYRFVADHLWLTGRDHDAKGNPLPGSHIVETYDLIERDLCWHPQIITLPRFVDFVREVKERFRSL